MAGPVFTFSSGAPSTGDPLGPCDPSFAINNPMRTAYASVEVLQYAGCFVKGNSVMTPPEFGTPGYRNWDFSLVKNWTLRERFIIQLRGEFFMNHPNFTNPFGVGGQLGAAHPSSPGSFGSSGETPEVAAANPVMGSRGPRAIQLGLKFKF